MTPSTSADTFRLVEHLFRHGAGKMTAVLTNIFGLDKLDAVEDAVQDALVSALKLWPYQGVPANPTAWLVQTAKNRMLDRVRRAGNWEKIGAELERASASKDGSDSETEAAFAREIQDDQLRMMFACCHPLIPPDGQVALTLKIVGGFSVAEIARAFLSPEANIAKILVRAKQRLKELDRGLEIPPPDRLPPRLDAVLRVIYLMFNEGYGALEGEDLVRTDLCFEAVRLAELAAEHQVVGTPKVHALAALLCFQASRTSARCDAAGEPLLLAEQDRTLWDRSLLSRGVRHLRKSAAGDEVGDYHLEAEIASCHALAENFEATDWARVLACYDELLKRNPSPVVALNRVVAFAKVNGPEAGLAELDLLAGNRLLRNYSPFHAVRGELLHELGRLPEAVACRQAAHRLTSSEPVRRFLLKRIRETAERMEIKDEG